MSSGELERVKPIDAGQGMTEVEFALVLSRIISSVNEDPEQLRQTIYDLARYKLKEQLRLTGSAEQSRKSIKALEIAIQGVEEFSQKKRQTIPARQHQSLEYAASDIKRRPPRLISASQFHTPQFDHDVAVSSSRATKSGRWSMIARTIGLIVVVITILSAFRYREMVFVEPSKINNPTPVASSVSAVSEQTVIPKSVAPASSSPLLPTSFGVYGVSDGKLFELSMLPSKAQDMRVAISPTVGITNQPTLPNGRVRFIVYRREAALSIPERAEVRIIARVTRAISFGTGGKQITTADDGWYIRNISFPYRVAPVKENPEMFEIRPESDEAELSPGRYALVLKGQVYDFIVNGKTADTRHCLERLTAANGGFVSECKAL